MWMKASTAKFIELYKKQKLLWDKSHPLYGEKESREMAFLEIRDGLIDRMPDLTILELKQKLHGLRTQHIKEKSDLKNNVREKPLLWCYDLLHFLRGEPEKKPNDFKMILNDELEESRKERPNWKMNDVLKLINSYKNYPTLWDTAHPNFFHRKERMHYYHAVWKELDKKFSIDDIKKKIKGLRTQYNSEKRAKYMAEKMGKQWKSKFWAYDYLKFWDPVYKSIETYEDVEMDNPDTESVQTFADDDEKDEDSDDVGDEDDDDNDEGDNNVMMLDDVQDSVIERPKWTKSDVTKLIAAYKKYPGLWDPTHPNCYNKSKRSKYYIAMYNAMDKKFDIEYIKKKIKGLRTQYASEHRILTKKSGKNKKKTFWAYELLKFIETETNYGDVDPHHKDESMNTEDNEEPIVDDFKDDELQEEDVDSNMTLALSADDDIEDMSVIYEKEKRKWTHNEIITLIDAYKNFKGLWDPKHANFSNQRERLKYYQALWNALDKKFDIIEIKKKIKCLRTQYAYEKRAKQIAKETGKQLKRKFWAYDLLTFWEPSCTSPLAHDEYSLKVEYVQVENEQNKTDIAENEQLISAEVEEKSLDPFDESIPTSPVFANGADDKSKKQRFVWLGKKLVDTLNTLNDEYVICNAVNKVEDVIDAAQNGDCSTISADKLLNMDLLNPSVMQENQFCVSLVFDVKESNFNELMTAISQLPALKDIKLSGKNLQNALLK